MIIKTPKFSFHKYAKELNRYTNKIDVNRATISRRKGRKWFRDNFVFLEKSYYEGNYYIGMLTVILMVASFNLPLYLIPIIAIGYFGVCTFFGVLSYRWFKFARRDKEIDDLMSTSRYMTWDLLKQLQEQVFVLTRTVNRIDKENQKRGGKKK
jgi:hypothetical protein